MAKVVKPIKDPDCLNKVSFACLGQLVRARRTQSGLTIEQASALCGVAKQTLMMIEHGNEKTQIGKVFQVLEGLGILLFIDQTNQKENDEWV